VGGSKSAVCSVCNVVWFVMCGVCSVVWQREGGRVGGGVKREEGGGGGGGGGGRVRSRGRESDGGECEACEGREREK
jgi:hypothetical protein